MKTLNIVAALLLLLLVSCTKDDKNNTAAKGFSMELNGAIWQSDTLAHKYMNTVGLSFAYARGLHIPPNMDNGGLAFDENITFSRIKKEKGRQLLSRLPAGTNMNDSVGVPPYALFMTWISQGCVVCRKYIVDTNRQADNWIEIEQEEGGYKKIWGKFSLVLVIDNSRSPCNETNYPDTLRIKGERFYIAY